jgi:hypothetical protein
MKIVGPARFRSIHTKEKVCTVPSDLSNCFYQDMSEDNIKTNTIDGVAY